MSTTVAFQARWLPWVLAGLVVLQLLLPSRVWIGLLVVLGGLWLTAYLWARQLAARLQVTREQHYGWVHVGDLLEERFIVVNNFFLPALSVEIDDASDLPGYSARSVRSADGYAMVQWHTEGICRQRGLFTLGPWRAHTGDPLGLYTVTFDHPEAQSVLVYPPIVHLPALRLPRGAATGAGRTSRRALDVTVNAAGVRAYVAGDAVNRIHWPTTARRDSLMVKTFDLEPTGDLWIVLDMDQAVQVGAGEESTEEYGVILAASLSNRTLEENRAVGLVAYGTLPPPPHPPQRGGRERVSPEGGASPFSPPSGGGRGGEAATLVMPGKGRAQQWRILEALATVRAGGRWPLGRVLAEMDRNLGRGTILAVITPSCDPEWIAGLLPPMRRGVTPTVLLLDPNTFGGSGNVEGMAALLADLGIYAERIVQGAAFRPIVEHERIGRPELKVLSGTGRVIRVSKTT